ncbi:MAG: site-specific DNA-methyltransferase [Caldicoprobacterales bacterium]
MTVLQVYPRGEYHKHKNMGESVDPKEIWGHFYWTDVLEGLSSLVDLYRSKVQLIYIDPPFMTGQLFRYRQKIGNKGIIEHVAYRDQWKEGKKGFLTFMKQVFEYAYELLTPDGSFYVHVDYRTSAYLRVLLDEIFGEDNFLNEIIWHYQSGGRAKRHFSRKHDNILFYRKSSEHFFDIDAVGIKRGDKRKNNMKREIDQDGRIFWSIKSAGKIYRYYEDSKIYPSDVWTDISHLHQRDPERTGYDTQKPETLLERIILSSSRPGDYVADFFAGSGTTLAVASRLNRKWIGLDSSPYSMHVCRNRLLAQEDGKNFAIYYEKSYKPLDQSVIVIEKDQTSGKGTDINTIKLVDYKPAKSVAADDKGNHNLDLKGLEHVNYWAVGYIKDDFFYPRSWNKREEKDNMIKDSIELAIFENNDLVVHIIDVWGNQYYYQLKY